MSQASQTRLERTERREFFRIGDAVALSISQFSPDNFDAVCEQLEKDRQAMDVVSKIMAEKEQAQLILRKIQRSSRDIGAYLKTVEQRLDWLSQVACQDDQLPKNPSHTAVLSGSGIAFSHERRLAVGDHVKLSLTLFPQRLKLHTLGAVVGVGRDVGLEESGGFPLAVNFTQISELDREQLLKHIQRLQFQALRSRRLEDDDE